MSYLKIFTEDKADYINAQIKKIIRRYFNIQKIYLQSTKKIFNRD
jgi:hypothetical protein